ncbi:MAG: hypothetical protein R3332_11350 [Pseudohongiellaceae bacterium]|nr:hypothetical protein [Pseudohongiellaceae bacterium]
MHNGHHSARQRRVRNTVTTAVFAVLAQASYAQQFAETALSIVHDDNITKGFLSSDTYSDTSAQLGISAGHLFLLPSNDTLTLFADIKGQAFNKLEGLDSQSLVLGTSFQRKFGLGAYATVFNATASWEYVDNTGKTRDRHINTLELKLRKRLSPQWMFQAGASKEIIEGIHDGWRYQSHYSSENDIYDFDQQSLFLALEYGFSNFSTLGVEYALQDGYTISSALAPNPQLLAISRALTLDPAIEQASGLNQVAYSIKTRAHILSVNWSIPIGVDSSLTLLASRQQIIARQGVDYSNNQLGVSLLHSF